MEHQTLQENKTVNKEEDNAESPFLSSKRTDVPSKSFAFCRFGAWIHFDEDPNA